MRCGLLRSEAASELAGKEAEKKVKKEVKSKKNGGWEVLSEQRASNEERLETGARSGGGEED